MLVVLPDDRDAPTWVRVVKAAIAVVCLAALAWFAFGLSASHAQEALVLSADDIRASLAECNNQFGAATKAYTARGQDYAANLNNLNTQLAAERKINADLRAGHAAADSK